MVGVTAAEKPASWRWFWTDRTFRPRIFQNSLKPLNVFRKEDSMRLSVLEQSTLSEGSSATEAIANTVSLARAIDQLGST